MFCDVPISDPQAKRADAESGHRVIAAAQFSRNMFVSVAKPVLAADRSQNATRRSPQGARTMGRTSESPVRGKRGFLMGMSV